MKNIEKYTNTKDALNAYNSIISKKVPFNEWLQSEVEGMGEDTLLEASERVLKVYFPDHREHGVVDYFRDAIAREKAKPVRNCDKYKTAKDALVGFNKMCKEKTCDRCPFNAERIEEYDICRLNWLFAEAEKEVSK